jgi:hypothetical protein
MSHINDPKHWRHRAAEARAVAESLTDPEAKQMMLKVAPDYEQLAKRAEERRSAGRRSLDQGVKVHNLQPTHWFPPPCRKKK